MSSGQSQNLIQENLPRNGEDRGSASKSRDQILVAAADCFKENGFAATSIDDVADMLGATKGMIYHHFRSKIDLFFAVYRRGMEINFGATEPEAKRPSTNTVATIENSSFENDTEVEEQASAVGVILCI